MITLFGQTYQWNDPEILLLGAVALVLLALLLLILRSVSRSATAAEPLVREISWLSSRMQQLGDGQERLAGGLHHVSEAQAVSQTATGIVLVDQHAAHERLVYERLKRQMRDSGIRAQALLIPEIVDLSPTDAARLLDAAPALAEIGLTIEPFGGSAIAIRETPAILGPVNGEALLRDILDELTDAGDSQLVRAKIDAILSRIACHGSVRSGRQMRPEEMNALLREMEATPLSGQCNHGRPTYVELSLHDIERLFGRR